MSSLSPLVSRQSASGAPETQFWQHFAKNYWERKELVTDDPALAAPMSEEQLFNMVSRFAESPLRAPFAGPRYLAFRLITRFFAPPRPREPRLLLRFVIESRWKITNVLRKTCAAFVPRRRLPRPEDGSFLGYHQRISRQLNPSWRRLFGLRPRRYCLIVNYPEMANFALWEATSKKITMKLYKQVGMNNGGYYYNIFIGDYSRTPFGVHRDEESLFHFPITGMKALRLWSPEFVQQHPGIKGCMDYAAYIDGSVLVKASPGETIYWPSQYWHIGEGEGQFSVSLGLGLVVQSEPKVLTQNIAQSRDPVRRFDPKTVPFDPDDLQESVRSIPLGVLRPRHKLKGITDTPTVAWLRAVTSIGALCPPAPDKAIVISDEELVCGHPCCPVVIVPSTDHQLLIGVAGHVFSVPDTSNVRGLIAFTNSRASERVGTLVDKFAVHMRKEEVRTLLNELVHCRGLVRAAILGEEGE